MLRTIVATRRRVVTTDGRSSDDSHSISTEGDLLENWIEYIQRSTYIAEDYCIRYGVTDWVKKHYQLKFRTAGHMARRTDNRWSRKVLYWRPVGCTRGRGRPCKRWSEDLDSFFAAAHNLESGGWIDISLDRGVWASLEDRFMDFCVKSSSR